MKSVIKFLRKPFVLLLTVPAVIAVLIGILPFATVFIEHAFAKGQLSPSFVQFDGDSARTLLSVIATGAMSALTLTYSLVLLVFTLAAGNVGPRLLKRFSTDLVNQITAGLFGGTFLYALITLLFTEAEFVPKFTIAGAVALSAISVLQLIFFVRHVAASVSIDDEVAEIAATLHKLVERQQKQEHFEDNVEDIEFPTQLESPSSGYIVAFDTSRIVKATGAADVRCIIKFSIGDFVLKDTPIACVDSVIKEEIANTIISAITIEPARSEQNSIEFSMNLLIEIAIRALSPGVNDTYTALAATDHISDVIGRISSDHTGHICVRDDNDKIRLITPGFSIDRLMSAAFHPLRQTTTDNLLMAEGLARSLNRLYIGGDEQVKEIVMVHADLLSRQLKDRRHMKEDVERVLKVLPRD